MNILEEYSFRNKISYPVAHHTNRGVLLLKTDKNFWDKNWCVLTVNWVNEPGSTGDYEISIRSPNHYPGSQTLFSLFGTHSYFKKNWEEYENFFFNLNFDQNHLTPVFNKKEAILGAWEIFLYINENWFLNQSSNVKSILFRTIDIDQSINSRFIAYKEFISLDSFLILNSWKFGFLDFIKNHYLDWFKNFKNFSKAKYSN